MKETAKCEGGLHLFNYRANESNATLWGKRALKGHVHGCDGIHL